MKFLIIIGLGILCWVSQSTAQIIHSQGNPPSWQNLQKKSAAIPAFKLPTIDLASLASQDELNDADKSRPYRFAVPFQTTLNPDNTGLWQAIPGGGRLWRLKLESRGALSLNVIFSKFFLEKGEQVFVYSENRKHVIGPLTSLNNKPWQSLATQPVRAQSIYVEYYIPPGGKSQGELEIGKVSHGYRRVNQAQYRLGDSQECNNNVICQKDWSCQSHSVVMLLLDGEDFCSGTLLNNHAQDGRPLVTTASHCLDNDVKNWVFMFNWISPACDETENGPRDQTVSGATTLLEVTRCDFALLEISEIPPASYKVFYSGWDASDRNPENQSSIHHPLGDVMKISWDEDPAERTQWDGSLDWEVNWESGTTEPGSSGSGLWDDNQRVIGQLDGGRSSCDDMEDPDYYGRLDIAWQDGADEFLDPESTGIMFMDGMGTGECAREVSLNDIEPSFSPLQISQHQSALTVSIPDLDPTLEARATFYNIKNAVLGKQAFSNRRVTWNIPESASGVILVEVQWDKQTFLEKVQLLK